MEENIKLVTVLEVPNHLRNAVTGQEKYIQETLQDIIDDSMSRGIFSQVRVVSTKVLGPGQGYLYRPSTEEIVPAAVGKGRADGEILTLNSEQCARVEGLLEVRLGRAVNVCEATLDTHADAVYARIGQAEWVTLLLHKGSTFVRWE